ncbi:sensor histidine kinase [Streptomonospora salina]
MAATRAARELLRPLSGRPTLRTAGADLLIWAALCLPLLLELAAVAGGSSAAALESPAAAAAASTALAAVVALSRPYPLAAAVLAITLSETWTTSFTFAVAGLCYLLGRRDPRAWPAGAAVLVGIAALATWLAMAPHLLIGVPGMVITYVFTIVLPWMVGSYRRLRENLDEAGWERARRLEREQRIAQDEARLRERSRIAQDMHDSLGHELSLIALRAGALELASDIPERHRTSAAELRESATTATERLREIVGVLRESGGDAPTEPAGEGIAELVERARGSGVDVALERSGIWEGVAPMVDRAAHRVVQEGLTNATKHAPGAPVRVRLERSAEEVVATVANRTPREPAVPRSADSPGGGRGLVGLAERVRLAGGTLETDERDGGFEVVARFPAEGRPAAASDETPPDEPGPAAADDHRRAARRSLRRRTAAMVAAGAVLVAVGVAFAVGSTYLRMASATLEPADYEALPVGAPTGQVEQRLPVQQYAPAAGADSSAAAERYDCRYYRSDEDFPNGEYTAYRLCFGGGELVSKDVLDAPGGTGTGE